jgi:hypothetical protein
VQSLLSTFARFWRMLSYSPFAEVSGQAHFFSFAFSTADFLAAFFALLLENPPAPHRRYALAEERPRRLVIGPSERLKH